LPPEAVTVSALAVLAVRLPLVPVMVTVDEPVAAVLPAVSVSVDVALPFAEGVAELGENDAATPEGSPDALNVTAESKLLLLAIVTVLLTDAPWASDRLLGEFDTEKDGDPLLVTVSAIVVLLVRLPLAPVMVTVAVPGDAELLAASVTVAVALPSSGGVIEPEDSIAVIPDGRPETLNVTAELKLSVLATVIVLVPDPSCATDRPLGEEDRVNDGWFGGVVPQVPPAPTQLPKSEVNSLL
jgi:hypothetical protein